MGRKQQLVVIQVFVVVTMVYCCKSEECEPPPPLIPAFDAFKFNDTTKQWSLDPPPWLKSDSALINKLANAMEGYKGLYNNWMTASKCNGDTTMSLSSTSESSRETTGLTSTLLATVNSTLTRSYISSRETKSGQTAGRTIDTTTDGVTHNILESKHSTGSDDELKLILIIVGSSVGCILILSILVFCLLRRRLHNKNMKLNKNTSNGQHQSASPVSVGYTNASFEEDTLTKGTVVNGPNYVTEYKPQPVRTISTEPLIPDSPCDSVTYEMPFSTIIEDQPNKDFNPDLPWKTEQPPIKAKKKKVPTATLR